MKEEKRMKEMIMIRVFQRYAKIKLRVNNIMTLLTA